LGRSLPVATATILSSSLTTKLYEDMPTEMLPWTRADPADDGSDSLDGAICAFRNGADNTAYR